MPALSCVLLAFVLVTDSFDEIQTIRPCVPIRHLPEIGRLVGIADLADVHLALRGGPTTAVLENRRRPDPDRPLPGGLRITTRCESGCCVDGLTAGGKVIVAAELDADDRRTCRAGWLDRVVRVVFQDRSTVSIYEARSWFSAGAAHANNQLRCRSFDLATGRPLRLGDVLPRGDAKSAIGRARQAIRAQSDLAGFTPNAAGIRFQIRGEGVREVQFCAEGAYPLKSDQILELDAR